MYRLVIEAVNKNDDVSSREVRRDVYTEVSSSKDELMKVMKNYLSDEKTMLEQSKVFNPDYYRFTIYEEGFNSKNQILSYIDFP